MQLGLDVVLITELLLRVCMMPWCCVSADAACRCLLCAGAAAAADLCSSQRSAGEMLQGALPDQWVRVGCGGGGARVDGGWRWGLCAGCQMLHTQRKRTRRE